MYIRGNSGPSRFQRIVKTQELQRNSLNKTAAWSSGGQSPMAMLGSGNVSRMAMKPFSPLYQESNLMLPKDRKTMNAYNRHYYETDYWVGNIIDLHTYYPLGGFNLISKDKAVEQVFREAADRINLANIVLGVGREFWVFGESYPFLEWDKNSGMWGRATIFNPDLIEVKRSPFTDVPLITLIPDAELKRLATSTHPTDAVLRSQLPKQVLEFVLRGENIPLNSRNISQIVRQSLPHDLRGTSIIQRVWKELMLRDAFREVLFVMAQNHITPLKIARVGSKDKDYYPDANELAMWQGIIEEAQNDPNFTLVTHEAFDMEYKGATGQIVDVTKYLELIEKNVLTGLFASVAMTHGDGLAYSNAQVGYDILQKRYIHFRNTLEQWLITKVFLPISIAHGFKTKDGEYAVPQIRWSRMDFNKDEQWRSLVKELNQADGDKKLIADRTLVTEIGFDYDEEQQLLQTEKNARIALKNKAKKDAKGEGEDDGMGGGLPGLGGGGALGGDMGGGGALPGIGDMGGAGDLGSPDSMGGDTPTAPAGGAADFSAPGA
jgi:hypothetical protein